MSAKVRRYEFEVGATMTELRNVIAAALDDEGLMVQPRQGERIVAVQMQVDGRPMDVICIPESRIVPKPDEATSIKFAEARARLGL